MASVQSREQPPASSDGHTQAICELITNGSIEMTCTPVERIPAAARLLPFGTSVYVPSPAGKPLDSNLETVAGLHEAGMEAVPHIAARKIQSREHLQAYLDRVVGDFGVHRVLVIGGDARQPAGPYADSTALLRDGVLVETGIKEIGVAGYPEGHPRIPPDVLKRDFAEKLELAQKLGIGLEVITQFSFAPKRITEFCASLSQMAPEVPVYVGIAGPVGMAKLVHYANYCGVSTSVRALSEMGIKAVRRMRHTEPDEQLSVLAQYCALRDACNVIGIHIFSFGGFERSAQWMRNHCRSATNEMA